MKRWSVGAIIKVTFCQSSRHQGDKHITMDLDEVIAIRTIFPHLCRLNAHALLRYQSTKSLWKTSGVWSVTLPDATRRETKSRAPGLRRGLKTVMAAAPLFRGPGHPGIQRGLPR